MTDIRSALSELVAKLDSIAADADYRAVWVMYQLHAGKYQGPTYVAELAAARAALNAVPREEPYINPEGNTCTHHPDDPAHGPQCVAAAPVQDAAGLSDWWRESAKFALEHGYRDDAKMAIATADHIDAAADALQAQRAEIAKLTKRCAYEKAMQESAHDLRERAEASVRAADARAGELETDAARYRFLREHCERDVFDGLTYVSVRDGNHWLAPKPPELDALVDAARAQVTLPEQGK